MPNLNVTHDDRSFRQPWEEFHTIIGEDTIGGNPCWVIESVHRSFPNYYLGKRVVWVDRNRFLELHEEQFDVKGKLCKIFDRGWIKLDQCPYWIWNFFDARDLSEESRSVEMLGDFIIDQGISRRDIEAEFRRERDNPWRSYKALPPVKNISDLPPAPEVRWEFWNQKGEKPSLARE